MKSLSKLNIGLFKFNRKTFTHSNIPKLELPSLGFQYHELEPVLSKELVTIHHSKHHQTYVTNYNAALDHAKVALDTGNTEKLIQLQSSIKFNGGSHINHSIYWTNLMPVSRKNYFYNIYIDGGGVLPSTTSRFRQHVDLTWGSMENLINVFSANTTAIQVSILNNLIYNINNYRVQDGVGLFLINLLIHLLIWKQLIKIRFA